MKIHYIKPGDVVFLEDSNIPIEIKTIQIKEPKAGLSQEVILDCQALSSKQDSGNKAKFQQRQSTKTACKCRYQVRPNP